ncbi:hypothetical protein BOKEGFJH_00158 [Chlamydia avium]|nr:hypothetical protein BOKEGFJH_00158 [Chlamydia avium]
MTRHFSTLSPDLLSLPSQCSLLFNVNRDDTAIQTKVNVLIKQSSFAYILTIIILVGIMIGGATLLILGYIGSDLPEIISGILLMIFSFICICLLISMIHLLKCLPSKVHETITQLKSKTSSLSSFQLLQKAYSQLISTIIRNEIYVEELKQKEQFLITRLNKWQELTHASHPYMMKSLP